jgi:hypothetical protein
MVDNTSNGNSKSLTFAGFVTRRVCALWIREAKDHKYLPSSWAALLPTTFRNFSGKMMGQRSTTDDIFEAIKAFDPQDKRDISNIVEAVMALVPSQTRENILPAVRVAVGQDMQALLQAFPKSSAGR